MTRGDKLRKSVRYWREREQGRRSRLRQLRRTADNPDSPGGERRTRAERVGINALRTVTMATHARRIAAEVALEAYRRFIRSPLRLRAFREAEALVGVMEQGGNNQGPVVSQIIRDNGGAVGEPWCGDFVAFVYRKAGSRAVTRAWASVWYLAFGGLAGLGVVKSPKRGDIVTFNFSHTGLFDRWTSGGNFLTIEGNTGASGAVSDSATGGDGVYRKQRHVSQVDRFVRVLR